MMNNRITKGIWMACFALIGISSAWAAEEQTEPSLDNLHIDSTYSVTQDTLIAGDSMYVITTGCAPVCSSVVQVMNKVGVFLHFMPSPFPHAIFPEAYIENQQILWRDNTPAILDDEEKKYR